MKTQLVTLENRASTVDQAGFDLIVEAITFQFVQARDLFARCGWVKRRIAPVPDVQVVAAGQAPATAWTVVILDSSDQQGALGYHDDNPGPYAKVFAVDCRQYNVPVESCTGHEVGEMLVDPMVDPMQPRMVRKPNSNEAWIVEVGDPCQGGDFQVTLPSGKTATLCDLALPSLWDLSAFRPCSIHGDLTGDWMLDSKGYMSVFDEDTAQWSQIYGSEKAPHVVDPDDPGSRSLKSIAPTWDHRSHRLHDALREHGLENFKPKIITSLEEW